MEELLLNLLPVLSSTAGITIISVVSKILLNRIANKNNDKVKEMAKANALLMERNAMLESKINEVLGSVNDNLAKTNEAVSKLSEEVNINKNSELELRKLVDEGITIRNEIRGLIEAKKE